MKRARTECITETALEKGGSIVMWKDAMPEDVLREYRECATKVDRVQSPSSFGHMTPRFQAHYHPEGKTYVYSKIKHTTTEYPKHVQEMLRQAEEKMAKWVQQKRRDQAVDIEYSPRVPRGGSIAPHADDEDDWSLVLVYSVGQTRTMIIRDKETKRIVQKVELTDNSVLLMNGAEVQKYYTHEVPKLSEKAVVGIRYSLNVRYK